MARTAITTSADGSAFIEQLQLWVPAERRASPLLDLPDRRSGGDIAIRSLGVNWTDQVIVSVDFWRIFLCAYCAAVAGHRRFGDKRGRARDSGSWRSGVAAATACAALGRTSSTHADDFSSHGSLPASVGHASAALARHRRDATPRPTANIFCCFSIHRPCARRSGRACCVLEDPRDCRHFEQACSHADFCDRVRRAPVRSLRGVFRMLPEI